MDKEEESSDAGNTTVVSIPRTTAEGVDDKGPKKSNDDATTTAVEKAEPSGEGGIGEEGNIILDSQTNKSQTTTTTTNTANTGAVTSQANHSPSISSISSLDSDSSTGRLIKSFSKTKLTDSNKENQPPSITTSDTMTTDLQRPTLMATSTEKHFDYTASGDTSTTKITKLPQSVASKTNFYNDLDGKEPSSENTVKQSQQRKKPIKFTVRKVSREAISTPSSPPLDVMNNGNGRSSSGSHTRQGSNGSYYYHKSPPLPSPVNTTYPPSQFRVTSSSSQQSPQLGGGARSISGNSPSPVVSPATESHELETRKKLAAAQRKYDQYEARIVKIDKEVQFLTNLLPPYTVDVDYNTRVKIQRAIEKLKGKQDELARKKYGLGITISRLWRATEGSEIWVRKVD
ncbi:hypothetical protein I9W82_001430 [Candida metapsilosis]|uniref:Uncharacterized protein n=1 Tax=Candida metapsilosis TaxID=273372 RepID=A0A8H7ZIB3_9ASCO|nr:hypothetical protein I9W82_001430 [Candida metapsilosis]